MRLSKIVISNHLINLQLYFSQVNNVKYGAQGHRILVVIFVAFAILLYTYFCKDMWKSYLVIFVKISSTLLIILFRFNFCVYG